MDHFARLFQLADFLQCPQLLSDIIGKLTYMPPLDPWDSCDLPSAETVALIYDELPKENSPFRQATVRRFLLSCNIFTISPEELEGYPGAFWLDVVQDRYQQIHTFSQQIEQKAKEVDSLQKTVDRLQAREKARMKAEVARRYPLNVEDENEDEDEESEFDE